VLSGTPVLKLLYTAILVFVQKQREKEATASAVSASVSKRKRDAEQSAEQRQQEAARLSDEEAFKTLLFEAVKDPSKATWGTVQVCDPVLVFSPVFRNGTVCL
jgi:hypothetical protein